MAERKSKPRDHQAESASGQAGSGRQHPTGTGPAYKAPKGRGSSGGKSNARDARERAT
jgi:hypothetical protein